LAASWSPDDLLLVLVNGKSTDLYDIIVVDNSPAEAKLILMTSTFDVLSETPIHKTEFGEGGLNIPAKLNLRITKPLDAPINVGWGASQTQFHGSLGKAAAAKSAVEVKVGASPDDDTLPRISWRGDGAFFVVSSLTPSSAPDKPRRVLRIYDRQAVLQSTSESVPGLEHSLAWRPSGGLIAGTQRFGSFEGGGVGMEGRHDVVFFERNGLRHGEFGIRSMERNNLRKGDIESKRRWGYRVRELSWSSDSVVLSVWIEGDDGDVGRSSPYSFSPLV
jgi:elongator complex protein 1